MIVVSPEEISNLRSALVNYPEASVKEEALKELKVLDQCKGDLEIATRVLARRAKEPVLKGDSPFETLVEKSREFLCKPVIIEKLTKAQKPLEAFSQVAAFIPAPFPQAIATLMLLKMGVEQFCNLDRSST